MKALVQIKNIFIIFAMLLSITCKKEEPVTSPEIVWQKDIGKSSGASINPVIYKNKVIISKDTTLIILNKSDGTILSKKPTSTIGANFRIQNNFYYFSQSDLVQFDLETETEISRIPVNFYGFTVSADSSHMYCLIDKKVLSVNLQTMVSDTVYTLHEESHYQGNRILACSEDYQDETMIFEGYFLEKEIHLIRYNKLTHSIVYEKTYPENDLYYMTVSFFSVYKNYIIIGYSYNKTECYSYSTGELMWTLDKSIHKPTFSGDYLYAESNNRRTICGINLNSGNSDIAIGCQFSDFDKKLTVYDNFIVWQNDDVYIADISRSKIIHTITEDKSEDYFPFDNNTCVTVDHTTGYAYAVGYNYAWCFKLR